MKRAMFAAFAALAACATPVATLSPAPSGPADAQTAADPSVLASALPGSTIAMQPLNAQFAPDERAIFGLQITNSSDTPLHVSLHDLSVSTLDGRDIAIPSAEQLLADAQQLADSIRASAVNQANESGAAASVGGSDSSASISNAAPPAGGAGAGGGARNTPSPSADLGSRSSRAQVEAVAATTDRFQSANARAERILHQARAGAFNTLTIAPGETAATPLTIDVIPADTTGILFEVTVGQAVHRFRWSYAVE